MRHCQGKLNRKGIVSLSAITTPTIIASAGLVFFIVFGLEIPYLFDQVASGSSFFVPSIPFFNLFDLVPGSINTHQFTIGNLVDLIIDIYILLTIGIIPYRWHRSTREPGIPFIDLQPMVLVDPARPQLEQGTADTNPRRPAGKNAREGLLLLATSKVYKTGASATAATRGRGGNPPPRVAWQGNDATKGLNGACLSRHVPLVCPCFGKTTRFSCSFALRSQVHPSRLSETRKGRFLQESIEA